MNFKQKLIDASRKNSSWLCVGLDPDPAKIPDAQKKGAKAVLKFSRTVIEATSDLVCAYKPNAAFYESMGAEGWEILKKTVDSVPGNIPVILDFKRGDIGNTAAMYARSAFEHFRVDAVTVSPLLGRDSVDPFIEYKDKGVFILCLTSNPSSEDFQKKLLLLEDPPEPGLMTPQSKARTFAEFFRASTSTLYSYIARLACEWNIDGNIGLVVGATAPAELEEIRKSVGDGMPILIPGVGAQGGDLEKSVIFGSDSDGELAIINVTRGIIYSWTEARSVGDEVSAAAATYRNRIREAVENKIRTK
jgi:orotidine-5'-phosphate decarboxylase